MDIEWERGRTREAAVTARSGGISNLAYPRIGSARITDSEGERVDLVIESDDQVVFATKEGEIYRIGF